MAICDELEAGLAQAQTDGGKLMEAVVHHVLAGGWGNLQGRKGGFERYRPPGRVKARTCGVNQDGHPD